MKTVDLDKEWMFRRGCLDSITMLENTPGIPVNLPHDGMIGTPVSADAPAGVDMGYFSGGLSNYTKNVLFPKEWENECVPVSKINNRDDRFMIDSKSVAVVWQINTIYF